ncbi:MAG: tetratricopeptide repeat protein [Deltaproteobacteria bacterium]|nr:tetratricopeptide repeat protein [Deltaproteobacteria bacterium]
MSQHDPQRLVDGAEPADRQSAELLARLGEPVRDDLARERVWRRLEAERVQPQRPPFFRMALAAAGSAALVFLVWRGISAPHPVPEAVLTLAAGDVVLGTPPQADIAAHAGQVLAPGSRLHTGASARAVLELGRAAAALDADTTIALDGPTRLRLTAGKLALHTPSSDVVLQSGEQVLRGENSTYEVRLDAAGETVVDVASGAVEASRGDLRWRVSAGQRWRSNAPDAVAASIVTTEVVALLEAVGGGGARSEVRVEGERDFRVAMDGAALGPAPTSVLASEGVHRITADSSSGKVELETRVRAGEPSVVRLAAPAKSEAAPVKPESAKVDVTPAPVVVAAAPKVERPAPHVEIPHREPTRTQPIEPKPTAVETPPVPTPAPVPPAPVAAPEVPVIVRAEPTPLPTPAPPVDHYARALELAQQGHAREAAGLLQQVVDAHEPRADLALYELGRLRQRSLGDLPGALDAFERYQSSYPRGALNQEVAISTIEVQLALQKPGAALESLDGFLAHYPGSERAHEMRLLRANLHRDRRDWSEAIDDYRKLEGTPSAAEALFFTAFCQRQSGDLAGAEASLRAYLERHPQGPRRAEVEQALGR